MRPSVRIDDLLGGAYDHVTYVTGVSGSRIYSCVDVPCNYSPGEAQTEYHAGIRVFSVAFSVVAIWAGCQGMVSSLDEGEVLVDSAAFGCFICTIFQAVIALGYIQFALRRDLQITKLETQARNNYHVDREHVPEDFQRWLFITRDLMEIYRGLAFCLLSSEILLSLFSLTFFYDAFALGLIFQLTNFAVLFVWHLHSIVWMKNGETVSQELYGMHKFKLKTDLLVVQIVGVVLVCLSLISTIILVV